MNAGLLQLFQPVMNNNQLFTEASSKQSDDFKQLIAHVLENENTSSDLIKELTSTGKTPDVLLDELAVNDELLALLSELLSKDLLYLFQEADEEELLEQLQAFINGDESLSNEALNKLLNLLEDAKNDLDENSIALFHLLKQLVDEWNTTDENIQFYPTIDINIQQNELMQLDAEAQTNIMQLISDLKQVFKQIHSGERMETVARQLLPLLQQWSSMNNQLSHDQLRQLVAEQLDAEDLEVLEKVQKLYESRTHFQSKNMYGNNATVSRSDVAQWLTAALNEPTSAEPQSRVIPTLNNEQLVTPRMSILNQQAIYNNSMESVQRVEAEITQRIVTQIQQNMLLQANAPQQSLSIRLAPEHLGTLNIQFTQVNGEMIVRIMTNSLATKEVLEANLQQLKHAFSPHQVQIVRDDTEIDEEMMSQQEEEQLAKDDEKSHDEQLEEQQSEEQIIIDFTSLIEEFLAEEVETDD